MFFKKNENFNEDQSLVKVAALLIHAAKIDQNYSNHEREIIKKTLTNINKKKENIDKIIKLGEEIEENSNQILDFTKEVKNMNEENKIEILENLWRIIYSNKEADMYETNLMRRLGGLLYIDKKIMADIKDKIKKEYL